MPKVVQGLSEDIAFDESIQLNYMVAKFEDSEATLVDVVTKWLGASKPAYDERLAKGQKNRDYWLGKQLDLKKIEEYKSTMVDNKIFQNLETMVPVAAANLPAPVCSLPETDVGEQEVDNRTYSRNLEEAILAIAQEGKLKKKLKNVVRLHQFWYLGGLKFEFEEKEGEVCFEVVDPRKILLPTNDEEEWVMERKSCVWSKLKEELTPEEVTRFERQLVGTGIKPGLDPLITYILVTLPEFSFKKWKAIVWDKKKNPNWDFKNPENNHWQEPHVNYVFTDLWSLECGKVSKTTLIEQTISLQDGINKRQRQISDNADHANGILVGYVEGGITKAELAEMERKRAKPNSVVAVEKGTPGSFQHFNGRALDPFVFENLQHLILEMDNLWGTHANLRGERTPGEETFGGRNLLKSSDVTRIGEIGEMLDGMAEELYNAIAQLIRVHFKKEHYIAYLGEDGGEKQVKINSDLVKSGVRIRVREGSSLRKDKDMLSQQAIVLWQNKALDPLSLYERIDDPNPIKTATRFAKWQLDPQGFMPEVKKDYDNATQSDVERNVLNSIVRADVENRLLAQGVNVPPYEGVTPHHIATHMDLMMTDAFKQLPPEVQQNFIAHVKTENDALQLKVNDMKTVREKDQADRINKLTENIMTS